jgi:hypothetical protein
MGRYQRGHVFEGHGAFHVRYYVTEIVDGQPRRVQRSERLCAKDNKHHSMKCKPVQQKTAEVMEQNQRSRRESAGSGDDGLRLPGTTYLPHVERNTKASTIHGYKAIWRQHLSVAFARINLVEMGRCGHGTSWRPISLTKAW